MTQIQADRCVGFMGDWLSAVCEYHALRVSVILAAGLISLSAGPLFAAELRCPPRLPGPHAGFERSGPIPAAHWLLWRMRLFDGRPDNDVRKELTPDDKIARPDGSTSIWRFSADQDLLMVCLYDRGSYYFAYRQPPIGRCVMDDSNGLIRAWCE
jgi:hypothetical protein